MGGTVAVTPSHTTCTRLDRKKIAQQKPCFVSEGPGHVRLGSYIETCSSSSAACSGLRLRFAAAGAWIQCWRTLQPPPIHHVGHAGEVGEHYRWHQPHRHRAVRGAPSERHQAKAQHFAFFPGRVPLRLGRPAQQPLLHTTGPSPLHTQFRPGRRKRHPLHPRLRRRPCTCGVRGGGVRASVAGRRCQGGGGGAVAASVSGWRWRWYCAPGRSAIRCTTTTPRARSLTSLRACRLARMRSPPPPPPTRHCAITAQVCAPSRACLASGRQYDENTVPMYVML